jgi:hypothetical protein
MKSAQKTQNPSMPLRRKEQHQQMLLPVKCSLDGNPQGLGGLRKSRLTDIIYITMETFSPLSSLYRLSQISSMEKFSVLIKTYTSKHEGYYWLEEAYVDSCFAQ